jgi:hypothetical protein
MLRTTVAAAAIALAGCATSSAQTAQATPATQAGQPASAALECTEEKPLGSQISTVRCRNKQNAARHRDAMQLELLRPRPFNLRGG